MVWDLGRRGIAQSWIAILEAHGVFYPPMTLPRLASEGRDCARLAEAQGKASVLFRQVRSG
jgi:hypothetical protein